MDAQSDQLPGGNSDAASQWDQFETVRLLKGLLRWQAYMFSNSAAGASDFMLKSVSRKIVLDQKIII